MSLPSAITIVDARRRVVHPALVCSRMTGKRVWYRGDGVLRTLQPGALPWDCHAVDGRELGLLIEEGRTNLLGYSQQLDHPAWQSSGGVTVTPDAAAAPDGTVTAGEIASSTADANRFQAVAMTSGVTRCASILVRQGTGTIARLQLAYLGSAAPVDAYATLTFGAGTVATAGSTGSIVAAGAEPLAAGWYRLWLAARDNGAGNTSCRVSIAAEGGLTLYAWGAQVEDGGYPTSCIPTTDSAATRAADVLTLALADLPGWQGGAFTLFCEASLPCAAGAVNRYAVAASDGTNTNFVGVMREGAGQSYLSFGQVISGGIPQASAGGTSWPAGTAMRLALAVGADDSALSTNGAINWTDSTVTVPAGLTTLHIGTRAFSNEALGGHLRRLLVWPRRIGTPVVQALTA